MENKTNIRVITLKDLWEIFIHRLWVMILIAALVVVGLFSVSMITFTPKYKSVATLYILRQNENQSSSSNSSDDFSLALKVVNDCNHLLKGHSVLDTVISNLGLEMSYDTLYDSVTVTNPSETRILEVKVESDSPELSKSIVDEICTVGTDKIEEAMGFQQVNLYEYGILDTEPCNRLGLLVYLLAGVGSIVLTYVAFLFGYLMDDRIRTDEDIEKHFGLSILGDIPDSNASGKKKNKYYRYYKGQWYSEYGYTSNQFSKKEEK